MLIFAPAPRQKYPVQSARDRLMTVVRQQYARTARPLLNFQRGPSHASTAGALLNANNYKSRRAPSHSTAIHRNRDATKRGSLDAISPHSPQWRSRQFRA